MCRAARSFTLPLRHSRYGEANQITYGSCFRRLHSNEKHQSAREERKIVVVVVVVVVVAVGQKKKTVHPGKAQVQTSTRHQLQQCIAAATEEEIFASGPQTLLHVQTACTADDDDGITCLNRVLECWSFCLSTAFLPFLSRKFQKKMKAFSAQFATFAALSAILWLKAIAHNLFSIAAYRLSQTNI